MARKTNGSSNFGWLLMHVCVCVCMCVCVLLGAYFAYSSLVTFELKFCPDRNPGLPVYLSDQAWKLILTDFQNVSRVWKIRGLNVWVTQNGCELYYTWWSGRAEKIGVSLLPQHTYGLLLQKLDQWGGGEGVACVCYCCSTPMACYWKSNYWALRYKAGKRSQIILKLE